MTIEQLENGKKLAEEIKILEEFQRAFQKPCMKTILVHSMDAPTPFRLSIETGSKLYKIIDDYISSELAEAKKQFDKI